MSIAPSSDTPFLEKLARTLLGILRSVHQGASLLFHTVWPHVVQAWNEAKNFVVTHPDMTIAIVMLVLAVLLAVPVAKGIIALLGFGHPGIEAGSLAAQIQSHLHGGTVPAGSLFSFLQSFGALA